MSPGYYIFSKNNILQQYDQPGRPLSADQWNNLRLQQIDGLNGLNDQNEKIIEVDEGEKLNSPYRWVTLRSLVGQVNDETFQQWGRAAQLLHWHKTNKFCGSCGSPTRSHATELARQCPKCSSIIYPSTSPCVIVLIHRNEEILLARSARFPKKMFSTLAGFIEPGESAEQAIQREMFEEVQVCIKNITYFGSQPWPFPGQLMLGYFAEFDTGEIVIDNDEICEAHWYSYDNLPQIPVSGTIAGRLIRHYVERKKVENKKN